MAKNLLEVLGGTNLEDLGDKTAISEDHTLTWKSMLDASLGNIAELNFKVLKSALAFDNGDNNAAENFSSAGGANSTVNGGATTANFFTNHYELTDGDESQLPSETGVTEVSSIAWSGTINNADGYFKSIGVQVNNSSGTLTVEIKKAAAVVATKNVSVTVFQNYDVAFLASDFSDSFSNGDAFTITCSGLTGIRRQSATVSKATGIVQYTSVNYHGGNGTQPVIYDFQTFSVSTGEVTSDTNTLAINSDTNSFALHVPHTVPTGDTPDGTDDTTTTSLESDSTTSPTTKSGLKVNTNEDLYITVVNKLSSCTATKAYVEDSAGVVLDTADFVGDVATFSVPVKLIDATDYLVVVDADGGSYVRVVDDDTTGSNTFTYPIVGTELDLISGISSGTTTSSTEMYNITSIITNSVNASGQATALSIDLISGANTINLPIDSVTMKSGVISKGALGDIANVTVKGKLSTTDKTVTPEIEGWGITKVN